MSRSVARIQFDGALIFILSASPVPFVKRFDQRERGVRFGERIVYLQSLFGRATRFRHGFVRREMRGRERVVGIGQSRVSESVFGVKINRLLEMTDGVV